MRLNVSFLDGGSTRQRTFDFKVSNNLLQAHISFKSAWQVLLAARAHSVSQLAKTSLTNDSATSLTVKWLIWQVEAADALKLVSIYFSLLHTGGQDFNSCLLLLHVWLIIN